MKKLIALAIPVELWRQLKAHVASLNAASDNNISVSAVVRGWIEQGIKNDSIRVRQCHTQTPNATDQTATSQTATSQSAQ